MEEEELLSKIYEIHSLISVNKIPIKLKAEIDGYSIILNNLTHDQIKEYSILCRLINYNTSY